MIMELQLFQGINAMPTKESIAAEVAKLNDVYANGDVAVKPEKDYILLKALETFVKDALEVCRPWALQAIRNYDEKERKNLYGAQVSIVSGKSQYDFSGDAEITELEQIIADAKAVVKEYESELKDLKEDAIREQRAKYTGKAADTISVKFLA